MRRGSRSLLVCTAAAAAERHPFSVEDLVRLKRVSDPALSPDGKTVVFVVRETDMAANRGRQDLWSLDLATKGAQPRRLTSNPENDNAPEWSRDGRYVYFVSSRSGSAQVWRLAASGGGEAEQVTSLPLDVGSFRLAPDGTRLAVSLDVFADCADLACSSARLKQAADSKTSGRVYDRTFVRHWDTWSDGRISQLFVLKMENGRAVEPLALTATLDADVPSKPFGDASEYTFSPDGTKAGVRRARQGQVGAVVDELRSLRSERRGRRAAQSHGRQSSLGCRSPCSRLTAACWRGARCSAPASKQIAST